MSSARDRELSGRLDRIPRPGPRGGLSFLGQVVDGGAFPTLAERYYLMQPLIPSGTEEEGATGAFADAGDPAPVVFLGSKPVPGERHVACFAGNRWVAQRAAPAVGEHCQFCELDANTTLTIKVEFQNGDKFTAPGVARNILAGPPSLAVRWLTGVLNGYWEVGPPASYPATSYTGSPVVRAECTPDLTYLVFVHNNPANANTAAVTLTADDVVECSPFHLVWEGSQPFNVTFGHSSPLIAITRIEITNP